VGGVRRAGDATVSGEDRQDAWCERHLLTPFGADRDRDRAGDVGDLTLDLCGREGGVAECIQHALLRVGEPVLGVTAEPGRGDLLEQASPFRTGDALPGAGDDGRQQITADGERVRRKPSCLTRARVSLRSCSTSATVTSATRAAMARWIEGSSVACQAVIAVVAASMPAKPAASPCRTASRARRSASVTTRAGEKTTAARP